MFHLTSAHTCAFQMMLRDAHAVNAQFGRDRAHG
jgi:hypothetical protein